MLVLKCDLRGFDISMYDPVLVDCRKSSEQGSEIHLDIVRDHLPMEHLLILSPMISRSNRFGSP